MAFDDILARDPKSEEEFWAIIEETFEQVEGALTDYPAETRDEALAGSAFLIMSSNAPLVVAWFGRTQSSALRRLRRLLRANTGHSPTARRTGHIDPLLPFRSGV